MLVNLRTFAHRSDTLKSDVNRCLIPAFVRSLTREPNLQHVRRGARIAPLLFQFPKSWFPFGFIAAALLYVRFFFWTPCVGCQSGLEFGAALIEGYGMPVYPNATVRAGEGKSIWEQADGVHSVPENEGDDEWE